MPYGSGHVLSGAITSQNVMHSMGDVEVVASELTDDEGVCAALGIVPIDVERLHL